jgi:tripartite-type tricarboxylate transporter receptor subunit TctC
MQRREMLLMGVAAALAPATARAQFPDRPVRIVVPFGAGGGIDSAARALGRGLAQEFGHNVVVENKPGGNSVIGASAVASSPPDGYTTLFTSGSTVSVLPHITKSLPLDPQKDLLPVGKVGKLPFVLVAHERIEAADFRQFLTRARAAPGKLTYASAGRGTGSHLGFELLKRSAGIDVTHVPYKATSDALPDLITGRVDMMMADPATARRAVAQGSVKALAVSTRERATAFPQVLPIAEQGVDGFDLELWFGLFVPKGTPAEVINRLNAALMKAMSTPESVKAYDALGFTASPTSPQELASLVQRESAQWGELARIGVLTAE